MKEGSARTSTRWGAREEKQVVGNTTVDCGQFADMKLLAPQNISVSLFALTDAPIAGIAVDWTLQIGNGSFNHVERFTAVATDVFAQVPITFLRPASSVQVSAVIRSSVPETKTVRVVAFLSPASPTWQTDITCKEEK